MRRLLISLASGNHALLIGLRVSTLSSCATKRPIEPAHALPSIDDRSNQVAG